MKKNEYKHPRYYTQVLSTTSLYTELEYLGNILLNNGDRTPEVIKIYFSDLNDYKFSESILDYLNKKEYSNVEKYIYLQKRILKHHIKNKRYE